MPNKADTTHQYSRNSTLDNMLHEILKHFWVQGIFWGVKSEINLKKISSARKKWKMFDKNIRNVLDYFAHWAENVAGSFIFRHWLIQVLLSLSPTSHQKLTTKRLFNQPFSSKLEINTIKDELFHHCIGFFGFSLDPPLKAQSQSSNCFTFVLFPE